MRRTCPAGDGQRPAVGNVMIVSQFTSRCCWPSPASAIRWTERAIWPLGPPWSSSCSWRCCGSSPGSRSPKGSTIAKSRSPNRSPRPSGTTATPGSSWPTTSRSWRPRRAKSAASSTRPAARPNKLSREMLAKAKNEARAEHQRAVAADRRRHGRRLARIGPAQRDPGRRAGRQDRPRRLDPKSHADLVQERCPSSPTKTRT